MNKKIISPSKEASDLEIKLQKEVARLEKKVLGLENEVLKSENKYLKLEQKLLVLQKKLNDSGSPEGLAEAIKAARERVRKQGENNEQDKRPKK